MSTATSHHDHISEENRKFHAFVYLALAMAAITGIELVIVFLPLPDWFILAGIVVLSVVKFVGVITWFMHLIYDKALCTIFFMMGLVIGIGTAIALLALFETSDAVEESIEAADANSYYLSEIC